VPTRKDRIYRKKKKQMADFNFGKETAVVFDDMLLRSVPLYEEVQRMMAELVADFAVDGTNIYDLGCSTGTTISNLDRSITPTVKFIGIDSSKDMIAQTRHKLTQSNLAREWELHCADVNQGINIFNASVVIMSLTLQFIRPLHRARLISDVHKGLRDQGCLIIFEKVLGEDSIFNRLFIKYYYDMKKRNGYSELEISQKREALENILIPYKIEENRELILKSGFRYFDIFFKWHNFCGMIAVK